MILLEEIQTAKRFQLQADSIFLNSCVTILNNLIVEYENSPSPKITIGSNFTLIKNDSIRYTYIKGLSQTIVEVNKENRLSKEDNSRFYIMVALLNLIKTYSISNYTYQFSLRVKKCGTWDVVGYGNSQTGSMYNAYNQAQTFATNNSNCLQVGNPNVSCLLDEHICFTSYTFDCSCTVTIPFIGLGW
ncbi:MAG TPA: hypothetical protein PKC62_07325 [Ferruginibacter sp.]|jgi:hypothetical protein|nr:hypothetical protein [Bacteroidota bacterium]MCC6692116.1 hypothetical protein [Chitinophagaceae bacterium]HMT96482.1 hypothetical protein [Ferruginibacter sp.]MBS1925019.1 hypothetical protein [Bacteroidota bacterium]HMU24116.1 hypothetical protein [Ferruginibacter sp.]